MLSPLSPMTREIRFREKSKATPTQATPNSAKFRDEGEVTPICVSSKEIRTDCPAPPPCHVMSAPSPETPTERFSFKLPDTPSDDVISEGEGSAEGGEREEGVESPSY